MKEGGKEQKEELGGVGGLLGHFSLKGQAKVIGHEWNQENIVIHSSAKARGPDTSWLENTNCLPGVWRLVGQTAVLVRSPCQSLT